jgi:AcrR family transcriptional regulator
VLFAHQQKEQIWRPSQSFDGPGRAQRPHARGADQCGHRGRLQIRLCRRQHGHIADAAGVSRGAILHQFGTRAALMAEVVAVVYQREVEIYAHYLKVQSFGHCIYDWPKILFDVLGRPSGIAVLEILIAAQSDSELDQSVRLRQAEVEEASLETVQTNLGGDRRTALAVKRLMVWAVRGLLMAKRIMPGDIDIGSSIELLSGLLKMAAPSGRVEELERFSPRGENPGSVFARPGAKLIHQPDQSGVLRARDGIG